VGLWLTQMLRVLARRLFMIIVQRLEEPENASGFCRIDWQG
jgi:hypothetical protein